MEKNPVEKGSRKRQVSSAQITVKNRAFSQRDREHTTRCHPLDDSYTRVHTHTCVCACAAKYVCVYISTPFYLSFSVN